MVTLLRCGLGVLVGLGLCACGSAPDETTPAPLGANHPVDRRRGQRRNRRGDQRRSLREHAFGRRRRLRLPHRLGAIERSVVARREHDVLRTPPPSQLKLRQTQGVAQISSRAAIAAVAVLVWTGSVRAAPGVVLDDPLTAPLGSGQTVNGGTFSSGGWQRDSFESKIIYDLGSPIRAGRIVFEMDGVDGTSQGVGGFPDCRAIFAALDNNGSGNIDDPGNETVQFLWAWAMEETDYCNGGPGGLERTNRMKLLVHTLGASEPGEPMSDPLAWDVGTFYTYEIGWNEDHAWLHRDGLVVLDQQYPSAPVIMNLRYVFLGTVNRYKAGVKSATYRNLKIYDDGGPVAPDAGSEGGGGSAGATALDAAGQDAPDAPDAGASGGGDGGASVHGSAIPADEGCGCRLVQTESTGAWLGLLSLLFVARRRCRNRVAAPEKLAQAYRAEMNAGPLPRTERCAVDKGGKCGVAASDRASSALQVRSIG